MEVETANEGKSAIHIALLWPILLNNGEYVRYGSGTFRESCVCKNFTLVTIQKVHRENKTTNNWRQCKDKYPKK
jgi:hypothetical protein